MCNDTYNQCGGACIADSPTSCGSDCQVCQVPPNGEATCTAGTCGIKCVQGMTLCQPSSGPNYCINDASCPLCTGNEMHCTSATCCSQVASVAAAGMDSTSFTCAGTKDGKALCWGSGTPGLLGNGTSTDSSSPVEVLVSVGNPLSNVTTVVGGGKFACALSSGGVKCWGFNAFGQLGNNTTTNSPWAVDVLDASLHPLANVTAIAVGGTFACALLNTSSVACWGFNGFGQLGIGTTVNSSVALTVGGATALSSVKAIAAGFSHACAIVGTGSVKCWGNNNAGQLGWAGATTSTTPVDVASLTDAAAFAGGTMHTCAVTAGGGAKCWGANGSGQLGNNSTDPSSAPVDVTGVSGVSAISASGTTCALLSSSGAIKCWGSGSNGLLGNNTSADSSTAVDVSGIFGATAVSVGADHVCAVMNYGGVKCWGRNASGNLGDGTKTQRYTPVDVIF